MECVNEASKLIAQALTITKEWDCTVNEHKDLTLLLEKALEILAKSI